MSKSSDLRGRLLSQQVEIIGQCDLIIQNAEKLKRDLTPREIKTIKAKSAKFDRLDNRIRQLEKKPDEQR